MSIIPVIFEDHLLARFRPLTWSTPVFEVRCGMFNTRERVDLCNGNEGGILLGRPMLRDLNGAQAWGWGAGALGGRGGPGTRFLFINGLLAPDFALVEGLFRLARNASPFVWQNTEGLVAALLDGEAAVALAAEWKAWEEGNDEAGVWADPAAVPSAWVPDVPLAGAVPVSLDHGNEFRYAGAADPASAPELLARAQESAPDWIWKIVDATGPAVRRDLAFVAAGRTYRREPFGIFLPPDEPRPDWSAASDLQTLDSVYPPATLARWDVEAPGNVYCGQGVQLAAGTAFDTTAGPVILDRGVRVMPHCYLEGPLYVGPGSLVKPGARLHGDSVFGIVNRIAGEVGESTFGDFANKQHAGFIGHAVLGAWINLGALTTCSDLKNNYGEIRVDLGFGAVDTGSRFVGLMMGDHAKSAIGTMFNTGTTVGFATNIFGGHMPDKFVGNFQWGGQPGCPRYAVDRACSTTAVVMPRRGCVFTSAHEDLFRKLGE